MYNPFLATNRRDGPCLEVVLWRPRSNMLPSFPFIASSSSLSKEEKEESTPSTSTSPNPTPPASASPEPVEDDEDTMELAELEESNNNSSDRVSAYTRSWVEENNNTGFRDLNSHPDNDDMDL